ncbi:MAG: hypothetical protein IKY78_09295 [Clostridia bacterium]|nr:hypothetical protein [Clostridia bacterium]
MKKLLSLILTVVMLFAVAAPAFTASAADNCITIYVGGYGRTLYKNNRINPNEEIYDIDADIGAIVSEVLRPCLEKLALGFITQDYDAYCDELYNAMAPLYDEVRLDKNGEATDGSGWGGNMLTDYYRVDYSKGLTGGRIDFEYDWRLSPIHNAEILEQFINRVCREKGVQKVNLLGRCLGGNLVSAYLENAENLDKINKVLMYIPSTAGISTIGAVFTGNIVIDSNAVNNLADYLVGGKQMIEDPFMQEFILAILEMLNYASVLGIGTGTIEYIVENVRDNIIPRLVRDTYGSFPSFWAMCPVDQVDEAVAFCYGTDELKEEYAGTIEKIYAFKEVQLNSDNRIKEVYNSGIDVMVLSKYDTPNLPFSEDGSAQSDFMAETYRSSFGATTAKYGEVLSTSYISKMSDDAKKFLSPDLKIDASTCLLPEKTWFIKHCEHADFPECVDALMNTFLVNDNFTVFSSENYPQYLDYSYDAETDTENLVPVTGTDEDAEKPSKNQERYSVFMRFFKAILNFISKLFRGELNLSFGKGE